MAASLPATAAASASRVPRTASRLRLSDPLEGGFTGGWGHAYGVGSEAAAPQRADVQCCAALQLLQGSG
eukprot:189264-Chlamydomonas_euryale.AAC.4